MYSLFIYVSMHALPAHYQWPYSTLLSQFHATLGKLGGSGFSLVTNGGLSLRHFLHPESSRVRLQLEPYLYQYLDIKAEFSRAFPDADAESLEKMCECILPKRKASWGCGRELEWGSGRGWGRIVSGWNAGEECRGRRGAMWRGSGEGGSVWE